MKILQLNFERGWRGGERQTLLSMHQFRAAGHTVELLARRADKLALNAASDGFVVHEYGSPLGIVWFLLKRGRYFDVLHAQTANTLTWLAALKVWLRGAVVFTRRTAFDLTPERRKRTLWKWRQADVLVAISEAAAAEPRAADLPVTLIPSAVTMRPINLTRAREFSQDYRLAGKRVLATAAALTREKDPETLIRAIARLVQTRQDFVFLHLGGGGDMQKQAAALVRELNLEAYYIFAGFQENVEDLYRLMDVFVSSSRQEALGTSVLDAFLYSVPVVSTNAGGLAQLVGNDRGLLCDVGDSARMAECIARLLDDAPLRNRLVNNAKAYVVSEHNPATMGRRYLDVYEELMTK